MKVGAVSTSNQLATEAAYRLMQRGGNAFDAAICATAVLGVVEPANSGLGGGGLWILSDNFGQSGQVVMVDSREESPSLTDPRMYKTGGGGGRTRLGATSCAIPGVPAAYDYINHQYGQLSLMECLRIAIEYAETGFLVDAEYHRLANARLEILTHAPDIRNTFLIDGQLPPIGHRIIRRDLARTCDSWPNTVARAFILSPVARRLVDGVNQLGGFDRPGSSQLSCRSQSAIDDELSWAMINTANSPSSGGVQLFLMLDILDRVEAATQPKTYTDEVHLLLEAMYRSYYYRQKYLSGSSDVTQIISDRNLRRLTQGINLQVIDRPINQCHQKPQEEPPPKEPKSSEQTTHVSIIDPQGNCVSATLSLNLRFGSCLIPSGAGWC